MGHGFADWSQAYFHGQKATVSLARSSCPSPGLPRSRRHKNPVDDRVIGPPSPSAAPVAMSGRLLCGNYWISVSTPAVFAGTLTVATLQTTGQTTGRQPRKPTTRQDLASPQEQPQPPTAEEGRLPSFRLLSSHKPWVGKSAAMETCDLVAGIPSPGSDAELGHVDDWKIMEPSTLGTRRGKLCGGTAGR